MANLHNSDADERGLGSESPVQADARGFESQLPFSLAREGIVQVPIGIGKAMINIVSGGGKSVILERQSVGRAKRENLALQTPPVLRSISKSGGIWEVFSEDLDRCGLSDFDIRSANVIYMMNPNENEPVFILKNRFGLSRFTGMDCLLYAINRARKFQVDRLILDIVGRKWSEIEGDWRIK